MTGKPCNENPCTMAANNDMKPNVPQRCIFYHGVSREKAMKKCSTMIDCGIVQIEGFQPDRNNNDAHVCYSKLSPSEHYGFENGRGKGRNCYYTLVNVKVPPELDMNENGYIVEATVDIKLLYNEIFYPRPKKDDNGDYIKSQRDISESIYLHELGHQLDTHYGTICYLRELMYRLNLPIQYITTKDGLTFNEVRVIKTEKVANFWSGKIGELLGDKYELEINHRLKYAALLYHQEYGKYGNPWEGREPDMPTPEQKNEHDLMKKELAEIEKKLKNIDTQYKSWENAK